MRKKAPIAVFWFAAAGTLNQVVRCFLKFPFLDEGTGETWIYFAEIALLLDFILLTVVAFLKGRDYEEALRSMEEDLKFSAVQGAEESRTPATIPGVSVFRA